jgi:hypothetical protein
MFPMRKIFLYWFVLFLLCFIFPVLGQINNIDPFVLPSARFAGLGGNHVAVGDSFHALFANPATLVDIERQFSAAELTISTYGPVFEIMDRARSAGPLDLSELKNNSVGFDIAGPLSLGWVGNGWGLGIFNRLRLDASMDSATVKPDVAGEIFVVGGYSFRLIKKENHFFDAGFLLKGFYRGVAQLEATITDALSLHDAPVANPFSTYLGAGLDLGIRYTFRENFAFSLVCFDVYSPVYITGYDSLGTVQRRLDMGIKYTIRNSFINRYISDLTIMADYRDILAPYSQASRNPFLNIGIGLELMMFKVLSFRFGLADALPAFGLGVDLSFMIMDVAVYGRELGSDPGKNSTYCLSLGFLFRY